MVVTKIISGGQTGADMGGLWAAQELRIETGGTAPPGWMTEIGSNESGMRYFGLVEGEPDRKVYPKRTLKNVQDSDGTAIFGDTRSPGTKATIHMCQLEDKPYIVNPNPTPFALWMDKWSIKVLNVAGNRHSRSPGIDEVVRDFLVKALKAE